MIQQEKNHHLYGKTHLQLAHHAFSAYSRSTTEQWLYVRSIEDGSVHFVGKIIDGKEELAENWHKFWVIRHGMKSFVQRVLRDNGRQKHYNELMQEKKEKKRPQGRQPRLEDQKKARAMRLKGKTYKEISLIVLGRYDKKQMYRWLSGIKKKVKKLSPDLQE